MVLVRNYLESQNSPESTLIIMDGKSADIDYELSGFHQQSGYQNVEGVLIINWAELIHSAISVGRKNWDDVFHHRYYSIQEIKMRIYMIQAFIKNDNGKLKISEAYNSLDPSEKGGLNYFIGCIFTKIFAERLFDTPWIMHLDVYKKNLYNSGELSVSFVNNSNSRPDFVGIDLLNNYNVFEAKGRANFSKDILDKAHDQSKKLKSINGKFPKLKLGCVAYHEEGELKMKIKDPEDFDEDALHLKMHIENFYFDYYAPVFHFINENAHRVINESGIQFCLTSDECMSFNIGMEKELFKLLMKMQNERSEFLKKFHNTVLFSLDYKSMVKEINGSSKDLYLGSDGILVKVRGDTGEE